MAETFVIAFQRRHNYDPARPLARPWLYGIATNLVGQHRRAEARGLRALSRAASEASGERSGDAEPLADRVAARVSAESFRAALAGALAELPARHRDVLLVIAWGDLDYAEAAQALDIGGHRALTPAPGPEETARSTGRVGPHRPGRRDGRAGEEHRDGGERSWMT